MSTVINMQGKTNNLLFSNTEIAFKNKNDKELRKAYWLYKIISSNFLTSIGPPITNFALKAGLPIKGVIRNTIFKQFCGGENIEDCRQSIKKLASLNVGTILDYSVEGDSSESGFDAACKEVLRTIQAAENNPDIPFSVFKPSGLGRFSLFEKIASGETLTKEETLEFDKVHDRIDAICKRAFEKEVRVLIDAEHSWIQNVIDRIALEYMQKYNRQKALIYNTYQLYRYDKLDSLKADIYRAEAEDFFVGAKLVRGAYMEIERSRAKDKGYQSPINENKAASDEEYNHAILFCLDHIERVAFMAGTHNEESSQLLVKEMQERNLPPNHPNIFFAQLYGMSDHISFNLAYNGFNVAKYLPYGSIKEVMPYLFRRAQENTSVAGQVGRELSLIMAEMKRRRNK